MDVEEALNILDIDNDFENIDKDTIKSKYRELSKKHHPDKGGDTEKMSNINEAKEYLEENINKNINNKNTTYNNYNKNTTYNNYNKNTTYNDNNSSNTESDKKDDYNKSKGEESLFKKIINILQLIIGSFMLVLDYTFKAIIIIIAIILIVILIGVSLGFLFSVGSLLYNIYNLIIAFINYEFFKVIVYAGRSLMFGVFSYITLVLIGLISGLFSD